MKRNFWKTIEDIFESDGKNIHEIMAWKQYIDENKDKKYAFRLLAIAYREAVDDGTFVGSYGKYINESYPDFKPQYFSQNKDTLRCQLAKLGVSLLKNGDDFQYLRTILKYSGKMCVNIAKKISENVHSWDEEQIKSYLKEFKKQFLLPNSEDQAFEDAEKIFLTIATQCRTNNLPPTLEELLDLPIDLTANVIGKIYDILFNKQEQPFETRPVIETDDNGKAFFTLPDVAVFRKEIGTKAVFKFISGERKTVFEYTRNRNWAKKCLCAECKKLDVEQIEEINLIWWDNEGNKHIENVLPEVCNHDFILVDKENSHPVEKLTSGKRYLLIPLKKGNLSLFWFMADGSCKEQQLNSGEFSVPHDAVKLRINESDIALKHSYSGWLNAENTYCTTDGCRLFLFASEENNVLSGNTDNSCISVRYGNREIYSKENVWVAPELWQKKSLSVYRGNECILTYPVTFIDDIKIDNCPIAAIIPVPWEEERNLEISIGEKTFNCTLARGEKHITIDYADFHLRIKIPRSGAYLELPESEIWLHRQQPHSEEGVVRLAKDDFKRARCHIANTCEKNRIFSCGNKQKKIDDDCISFKLNKFKEEDISDTRGDFCSLFMSPEKVYRIRLYDPMQYRVSWEHKNNDLVVKYVTSYLRSSGDKYLVYFPAHLQDKPFKSLKADEVITQKNEDGSELKQILVFKDLYKRKDIDWGKGLLSFVASKLSYLNNVEEYKVISQGFFIQATDELQTEIQDDPYCLRRALADCNVVQLCDILNGDDEEQRKYVARFIENMTKEISALDIKVFNYLNSYWNTLFNSKASRDNEFKQSGYIFQAGWFFVDGPGANSNKNDLSDDYRPYWDYLMFADKYWKKTEFQGTQEILNYCLQNKLFPALKGKDHSFAFKKELITLVQERTKCKGAINRGNYDNLISHSETVYFSYPQISEFVRNNILNYDKLEKLKKISPKLCDAWQNKELEKIEDGKYHISTTELEKHFNSLGLDKTYLYQPGYKNYSIIPVDIQESFDCAMLQDALDSIADELYNWRQNPTLQAAQGLREILIMLRNIDDELTLTVDGYYPMRNYIAGKLLLKTTKY